MGSDIAHEGIRKILNYLDDDDVKQLACTTTQNCVKQDTLKSKEEAIKIIIQYSTDYSAILNRKSVKRDILFQYLHDNKIFVTPPITKLVLIQKILELWTINSDNHQEICTRTEQEELQNQSNNEDINLMANKFTEWFYSMLNADEPIGEEHFWQDCSLQINLVSPSSEEQQSVDNDRNQVVNMLFNIKSMHNLFFNPNLSSDGVFGKMDVHGLVVIFSCGTLHSKDQIVGVFEQIFSLARDPFCENNWKIKNTRLNLRSKAVTEPPRLCDSGISNDVLLSLTES